MSERDQYEPGQPIEPDPVNPDPIEHDPSPNPPPHDIVFDDSPPIIAPDYQPRTLIEWYHSLPDWLIGGSPLYLISGASILYGLMLLLNPQHADESTRGELFLGFAALNVYELAVLGIVLVLMLIARVRDDAISLVVLIAIMMIASAVVLDTIALQRADAALYIGIGALLFVAGKLWAVGRFVTSPLGPWQLIGVGLVMTINFMLPVMLAYGVADHWLDDRLLPMWIIGWWVTLTGGGLLLVATITMPDGFERTSLADTPFIHSPAMRWVFVGLLFAGTAMHLWATTYAFSLPVQRGDLLPALCLIALLAVEVRRTHAIRLGRLDGLILLAPLVLGWLVVNRGEYSFTLFADAGLISYPPIALGVYAALIEALAWRRSKGQRSGLHIVANLAGILAIATFGCDPNTPFAFTALRWSIIIAIASLACFGLAIYCRSLAFAILGTALMLWDLYRLLAERPAWFFISAAFVILALGTAVSLNAAPKRPAPESESPDNPVDATMTST